MSRSSSPVRARAPRGRRARRPPQPGVEALRPQRREALLDLPARADHAVDPGELERDRHARLRLVGAPDAGARRAGDEHREAASVERFGEHEVGRGQQLREPEQLVAAVGRDERAAGVLEPPVERFAAGPPALGQPADAGHVGEPLGPRRAPRRRRPRRGRIAPVVGLLDPGARTGRRRRQRGSGVQLEARSHPLRPPVAGEVQHRAARRRRRAAPASVAPASASSVTAKPASARRSRDRAAGGGRHAQVERRVRDHERVAARRRGAPAAAADGLRDAGRHHDVDAVAGSGAPATGSGGASCPARASGGGRHARRAAAGASRRATRRRRRAARDRLGSGSSPLPGSFSAISQSPSPASPANSSSHWSVRSPRAAADPTAARRRPARRATPTVPVKCRPSAATASPSSSAAPTSATVGLASRAGSSRGRTCR